MAYRTFEIVPTEQPDTFVLHGPGIYEDEEDARMNVLRGLDDEKRCEIRALLNHVTQHAYTDGREAAQREVRKALGLT